MKKDKETNPMFTKKGLWLWILCAPLAIFVAAYYDCKINTKKWKEKRERRENEFRSKYPEFDWWQDDRGL